MGLSGAGNGLKTSKMRKKPCNAGPTNTFIVNSPIGMIEIVSCPRGLHSVGQPENVTNHNFLPDVSQKVIPLGQMWPDNGYTYRPALQCIDWLVEYFNNPLKNLVDPPTFCSSIISENEFVANVTSDMLTSMLGTVAIGISPPLPALAKDGAAVYAQVKGEVFCGGFQEQLWYSLQTHVTAGHTISYAELAILCNNPKAHRAVGTAMRKNPFQILVPCHRVLRSDGSLGGYCGNTRTKVKEWLLEHEGQKIT